MTLPDDVEEHFQKLYQRTYEVLLCAGCDDAQARAIARERVMETAQRMVGPDITVTDFNPTEGDRL